MRFVAIFRYAAMAVLAIILFCRGMAAQQIDDLVVVGSLGVCEVDWMEPLDADRFWIAGNYLEEDEIGPFPLPHLSGLDAFVAILDTHLSVHIVIPFQSEEDDFISAGLSVNGGLYITGTFWDSLFVSGERVATAPGKAIFLARMDQSGGISDLRVISGDGIKEVRALRNVGGDILIAGSFSRRLYIGQDSLVAPDGLDGFIMRFSEGLQLLDRATIPCNGNLRVADVCVGRNGIGLGGEFLGTFSFGGGTYETRTSDSDGWVGYVDFDLQPLWAVKCGGVYVDKVQAMASRQDTIYAGGHFLGVNAIEGQIELQSQGFQDDLFLFAFREDGQFLGGRKYGGAGGEALQSMRMSGDQLLLQGSYKGEFAFGGDTVGTGPSTAIRAFFASVDPGLSAGHLIRDEGSGVSEGLAQLQIGKSYYGAGYYRGNLRFGPLSHSSEGHFQAFLCKYRERHEVPVKPPEEREFSVYPNPVNDILYFSYEGEIAGWEVFDGSGQYLLGAEDPGPSNLSRLNGGLYFLRVRTAEGGTYVRSFLKL